MVRMGCLGVSFGTPDDFQLGKCKKRKKKRSQKKNLLVEANERGL